MKKSCFKRCNCTVAHRAFGNPKYSVEFFGAPLKITYTLTKKNMKYEEIKEPSCEIAKNKISFCCEGSVWFLDNIGDGNVWVLCGNCGNKCGFKTFTS